MFGLFGSKTAKRQRRADQLIAKGRHADAFEVWYAAAEKGDAEACHRVGLACLHGQGTLRFLPDAVHWFTRAAEPDHADAQFHLATLAAVRRRPQPI